MMGKALNCHNPHLFNAKMLRQASKLIEFGMTTYRQQLVEGNYCHHMSELVLFTGVNVKKCDVEIIVCHRYGAVVISVDRSKVQR